MLRKQLAGLSQDQRDVQDIPRGLAALISSAWERIATDPAVVDGVGGPTMSLIEVVLDRCFPRYTSIRDHDTVDRVTRSPAVATRGRPAIR